MLSLRFDLAGTVGPMTLTTIIILNVVLDVALLAGLAFVMAHPRKLTPHRPGATGNDWRLRHGQRRLQQDRARSERPSTRVSPALER